MIHPLRLYDEGLRRAASPSSSAQVRLADGTVLPLALALKRYTSPADETDETVLSSVRGPVLDVGCGPGRHLHALARRGEFALGVDLSPVAVALARGAGGNAIVASIFDELPGAGTWQSALLLDGNIGIGGAPDRLLARVGSLLRPGGELLVELGAPNTPTKRTQARLETSHGTSAWFPWARVAAPEIVPLAQAGGFQLSDRFTDRERWFARLLRAAELNPAAAGKE